MGRYLVAIKSAADRQRALGIVQAAPTGSRVEIKAAKRTLPQNSLLWSMLSDIATELPWHGTKLTADDWKLIFLDALNREVRLVPNLDGDGMVNLGRRSSDLSKQEMGDLIELIKAFGANHNIKFIDERDAA